MTDEGKWDDVIPEIDNDQLLLNGGLERIIDFGIVAAYQRWCGKSDIEETGRTESIMVSCPRPDHPDKIPSAWLNSEKNVWFCGGCNEGGDIMDIGAYRFGFPITDYKEGRNFPRLIETMLVDMGVDVESMKTKVMIASIEARELKDGAKPAPEPDGTQPAPVAKIADPEFDDAFPETPLDWEDMIEEGTFLHAWMKATTVTRTPDEYLFFLGLQMLSLAVGRKLYLDSTMPVYPNILLALMGSTGTGKSQAIRLAERVVRGALPFDPEDSTSQGVKNIGRPASGEALVDSMCWMPSGVIRPQSVKGWLQVDEMAELMTASSRRGSTLREVLLQMYDGKPVIDLESRGMGRVVAVEPFLNLVCGAQPDAISKIMDGNDVASGFANRFIYVSGERKPRKSWAEQPTVDLDGLDLLLAGVQSWTGTGTGIILDPLAEAEIDESLEWIDKLTEESGDVFARMELHYLKLIVLICANEREDIASVKILGKARKLIEYVLSATQAVEDATGVSERSRYLSRVEEIVSWFPSRRGGKYPTSAMVRGEFSPAMRKNSEMIFWAIETMVRQGHIMEAPLTKEDVSSGRSKPRYRVPA